jgi:hypothetical protein
MVVPTIKGCDVGGSIEARQKTKHYCVTQNMITDNMFNYTALHHILRITLHEHSTLLLYSSVQLIDIQLFEKQKEFKILL